MHSIRILLLLLSAYTLNAQKIGDTLTLSSQLITEGIKFHDEEKYEEAIALYNQVSPYDTSYSLAIYEKGLSLFGAKKYAEAIATCKLGISLFESNRLDNLMMIAQSYDDAGNVDSANYFYNRCKKEFPHTARPYYEQSIPMRKNGKWAESVTLLDSARMKNIFTIRAHYMYSDIAYSSGEPALGLLALQFASLITNNPSSQYQTYQLLVKMSDDNYESALQAPAGTIKNCESLAEINELVKAKVALTDKYKVKTRLDERYIRQMQFILERLETIPSEEENPMANFYLDFYKQTWEKGFFEAAVLSGLSALKDVNVVATAIKKKKSEIEAFEKWANKYLVDKRAAYVRKQLKVDENVDFVFHSSGQLAAYGPKKDSETRNGDWIFYSEEGYLVAKGGYTNDGKKSGHWDYYYANGNRSSWEEFDIPNSKITYALFYENGVEKESGVKINGKIDGELKEYHPTGALKRTLTVVDGQLNGLMIGYFASGAKSFEREFNGPGKPGMYRSYFENGQLNTEVLLTNNALNGELKKYYTTGQLKEVLTYINDKKDGVGVSYYRNGTLRDSAFYKSDKLNGKKKNYNIDGSLNSELEYKNGKINGMSTWYDDVDGKMYGQLQFRNERLAAYEFFDKEGKSIYKKEEVDSKIEWVRHTPFGNISEKGTYKKGEFDGQLEKYYPNGSVRSRYEYSEGHVQGKGMFYYRNGALSNEVNYNAEGNRDGFTRSYFVTGELKSEGYYVNDNTEGRWKYYYRDGKFDSDEFHTEDEVVGDEELLPNGSRNSITVYLEGNLVKEFTFNEKNVCFDTLILKPGTQHQKLMSEAGYVRKEGDYVNAHREGVWTFNYGANRPRNISNYLHGKLHGTVISYYSNGSLSSKGNYVLGSADSTFEFYDELGRFTTRKFYELGNEEGNEVTFYPSGKKFTEYVYKGDELNGPNRMYAEDGSLMLERMFYDGEIVAYSYEGADGTMITVPFTSGTGEIKTYYKNGKVSAIIGMNNGQRNGKFVLYMPNGEVLEEKNYVDGELEGSYKEFHTNGKLFVEATYKNGKLEGVKKVYQPSGALFSSENYEGGTIHNESTYYGLDGKKAVVVNYYYGHEVKK